MNHLIIHLYLREVLIVLSITTLQLTPKTTFVTKWNEFSFKIVSGKNHTTFRQLKGYLVVITFVIKGHLISELTSHTKSNLHPKMVPSNCRE